MLSNRVMMSSKAVDATEGKELIAGDLEAGFYGEVSQENFVYVGRVLAQVGGRLIGGELINGDTPWLKFSIDGKTIYKTKKPIAYKVTYSFLEGKGVVFGTSILKNTDGKDYKVRLMKGANTDPASGVDGQAVRESEWNRLMLPITIYAKTGDWADSWNVGTVPYWGIDYTNDDLGTIQASTKGSQHWCQEYYPLWDSYICRGYQGVSYSGAINQFSSDEYRGWSPVLEEI